MILGKNLKVGNTIKVWWDRSDRGAKPNEDKIVKLTKYDGPLNHIFKHGARIAEFAYSKVGMTIPNDEVYEVVS